MKAGRHRARCHAPRHAHETRCSHAAHLHSDRRLRLPGLVASARAGPCRFGLRYRSLARRLGRVRCNDWFGGLPAKTLVRLYVGFPDDFRPTLDVGPYEVLCVAYAHGDRLETQLDDPGSHFGCTGDPGQFGVDLRNNIPWGTGWNHEAVPAGDLHSADPRL